MRTIVISLAALFAISFSVSAQEIAPSKPAVPSQILGPQLIAWSQQTKPQPIPQPLPPPEQADQQTSQKADSQNQNAQDQQNSSAQVFTGTIVKDESRYVLKAADGASYQLDDQQKAKQYEGKQVKIVGSIDAHGTTLHISSIELLS
jgi:DNA-nicking Smr family endonuclease